MRKKNFLRLTVFFLICLFFCGCQQGPTDEELIKTTMKKWRLAMMAQELDAVMVHYSEEFSSSEAEDKEEMHEGFQEALDMGMLDNLDINLETSELTIRGDTAEITIFDDDGEIEMAFTLRKEGKNIWRIIGIPSEACSYERYYSPYGDDCVEHKGYNRCWDIYIPEGLTGNVPLVIDLHGWTEGPSHQRAISGFQILADSEKFIVVWPYGLCGSWNSGAACCPPASEDDIDDVGFLRKLVEKVSGQYDIDSNRIYVTGLSNGCAMAQRLANEASDIIAACACMSLHLLVPENPEYHAVSVMTMLGTDDDLYEPGELPGALENFDTWKQMNHCTGDYTVTWSSGNSVAWTYQDCEDGTEVCLVTIDGGGHVLYKGVQTDIDTARLAWEFLKRFAK